MELVNISVKRKPTEEESEPSIDNAEKKNSDTSVDWMDNVIINKPKQKTIEKPISSLQESHNESRWINNLPNWVDRPWMFITPKLENQVSSWIDSWTGLVIDYCQLFQLHIVNTLELMDIYPFSNKKANKKLTSNQIQSLFEEMEKKGIVKWLGNEKILARVYYKSIEQWSSIIIDYLMDTGLAAEVLTFHELSNQNQEWSTLPRQDFIEIFELLVSRGRAKWIGKSKDTITIEL
ncbi:MAG: hypothetical protein OEY49_14175 [Candidatus Heimdallarchaeota archaeon]|nr:hypothetical protein [Candidatus Heimdallarchaeota archaeon]